MGVGWTHTRIDVILLKRGESAVGRLAAVAFDQRKIDRSHHLN